MEAQVERDIAYAVYARVMKVGTHPDLATALTKYTTEQLQQLQAWTEQCDRQQPNERFYILETDGYRMPDSVQNLYGKRYLTALNAIKQAIVRVMGERALEEVVLGDVA
jgi:hypothetical protein